MAGRVPQASRSEVPVLTDREFVPMIRLIESCPVPAARVNLIADYAPQFKAKFRSDMELGKALFPVFYAIMTAMDALKFEGAAPLDGRKVAKS